MSDKPELQYLKKLTKKELLLLIKEKVSVTYPGGVVDYIRNNVKVHWNTEQFIIILLNSSAMILNHTILFKGTINKSIVGIPEILRVILSEPKATSFIIAHNHPSGTITPSDEDVILTDRIKNAAGIMGIEMVDHIIFTELDYYSFNNTIR